LQDGCRVRRIALALGIEKAATDGRQIRNNTFELYDGQLGKILLSCDGDRTPHAGIWANAADVSSLDNALAVEPKIPNRRTKARPRYRDWRSMSTMWFTSVLCSSNEGCLSCSRKAVRRRGAVVVVVVVETAWEANCDDQEPVTTISRRR
jgi:hypothetical protein